MDREGGVGLPARRVGRADRRAEFVAIELGDQIRPLGTKLPSQNRHEQVAERGGGVGASPQRALLLQRHVADGAERAAR